jgi:ribosome-interacting GTPase 1
MPFGLHGAPGTFQTLIDKLINAEFQPDVFGYMDDIIIVTDTFEKHLHTLEKVLERLLGAELVLNREKCNVCKPELKYLGYIDNRAGLNIDAEKVKAIVDMPPA